MPTEERIRELVHSGMSVEAAEAVLGRANLEALYFANPALADDDRFVVSTDMKVGAYTVANASPTDGLARNVVVTVTPVSTLDTMGTVTITGTDVAGDTISEVITPASGVVTGLRAFKTVTGAVGAGWVVAAGADQIKIGFGNLIGLPAHLRGQYLEAAQGFVAFVAGAVVAATWVYNAEISKCTIDASAATYDGAKDLTALVRI